MFARLNVLYYRQFNSGIQFCRINVCCDEDEAIATAAAAEEKEEMEKK